jgi:hypothetical protein
MLRFLIFADWFKAYVHLRSMFSKVAVLCLLLVFTVT